MPRKNVGAVMVASGVTQHGNGKKCVSRLDIIALLRRTNEYINPLGLVQRLRSKRTDDSRIGEYPSEGYNRSCSGKHWASGRC